MKTFILFLFLILIAISVPFILPAQAQKLSLFEIIKQLIPNSNSQQQVGSWNVLLTNKSVTNWAGHLACDGNGCTINGAIACMPAKIFGDIDSWGLTANGTKEGYTDFELFFPNGAYTGEINKVLDALFANENYKASVFQFCKKRSTIIYTLQYPGKNTVWLKFMFAEGAEGNSNITVDVFLSAKTRDFGNNCNY